jgi:hypothetical protein
MEPMAADDVPRCPERRPGLLRIPVRGRAGRPVRKVVIGAGLAAYSWVAASTVPFTRNALLVVLLPGAVVAVLAYGRPVRRIPAPDRVDVTGCSYWAVCVIALFEWEAAAFRDNSLWWHPSLTALIDPVLGVHPVKAAAILIWLLSGWALVRR